MNITISDTVDSFVMNETQVEYQMQDETVRYTAPSELAAFVQICSQMFYDHEYKFEEDDEESAQKIRALFDEMCAVVL